MMMAISMLNAQAKIIKKLKLLKMPIFMALGEDDQVLDSKLNFEYK